MTKSGRLRVWLAVAALTLAAALTGGVRAQQGGPATDTFANNSSTTPVYEDSYSSSCDEKNHGSLATDSPNPGACFDVPKQNGQCMSIGGEGSTLEEQSGNNCIYCQPSPQENVIVVPNDSGGAAYAAYQQGFQCSANPGDSCYLTCYGPGTFKPPPGVTLKAGTGTGGAPPLKLQGSLSNGPDPCYPAGPKNYDACDYPNVTRPPGCTCSKTPAPQAATPPKPPAQSASNPCLPYGPGGYDYCQNPIGTRLPAGCSCNRSTPKPLAETTLPPPPIMAQAPPGTPTAKAGPGASKCLSIYSSLKLLDRPVFTSTEVATLTKDLAEAKATVTKAKTFTDLKSWDEGTQAISKKYFGNATSKTQALMRKNVSQVLTVLNNIKSVTNALYPSGADLYASIDPPKPDWVAYVRPQAKTPATEIFILPLFFKSDPPGADSQAMTLVHEASHLPAGASTEDVIYGQLGCQAIVLIISDNPFARVANALPFGTPVPANGPLINADSFKYFVYEVANQGIPKGQK